VIDALSGGNTNPGGQPRGRFTSVTRQDNGRVYLQFVGESARRYIIEASTNLVDWEMIGVATGGLDRTLGFEDSQTMRFAWRFYRVISP